VTAGPKAISHKDMGGLQIKNLADGTLSTDAWTKSQGDTAYTNAISRANHTGTQLAATVSDFDTQVRTSRLDQMAAPTGALSVNNQRITNAGSATTDTDAAQWGQVKDLISGLRKADVRIVTTTNDALTGLAARDGITPVAGDRVLATAQTTASANGIYVAAAGAWSRATDADAAAEFATQWLVTVREGTVNGDTLWQHNTDGTVTLNTTSLVFNKIGPISAAAATGYTTTSPVVTAGGTWTVTHNLGSRYVLAQVARVASPYDIVDVRIERTTTNTLSVLPDVAMASGEYEVMVQKVA
jgi:hypothetical protein